MGTKVNRSTTDPFITDVTKLPDGSGFFIGSFQLPKDHWSKLPRPDGWDQKRDCSIDQPYPILGPEHREAVKAAVRWGYRGASMLGTVEDIDPDALVMNILIALCGPPRKKSRVEVSDDYTS